MKIIKSLQNEVIKDLARLKEKKYRDETKLFLVEGEHLVSMAKEANKLKMILVDEESIVEFSEYIEKIETIIVNQSIIQKLSFSKTPQSIIGVVILDEISSISGDKVVVLDEIQDPGNLGTLLRSALSFGYQSVILSENCVDLYNDKVIRASQGSLFKIKTLRMPLNQIYRLLKKENYQIIVTSLSDKSNSLNKVTPKNKFALVLGNEGNGVSDLSLKNADLMVKIEMSNEIDSLNVAVAGSIIMYLFNHKGE